MTRRYHHGNLRDALIKAGLEVIAQHGPAALTLGEVVRRTGVSRAAPYRHFAGHQALLAATAAELGQQLAAELRQAQVETTDDPAETLAAGMAVYVGFLIRRGAAFDLLFAQELAALGDETLAVAGRAVMDRLLPLSLSLTGGDARAALELLERCVTAAHGYGALYRSGFLTRRFADAAECARHAASTTRVLANAARTQQR